MEKKYIIRYTVLDSGLHLVRVFRSFKWFQDFILRYLLFEKTSRIVITSTSTPSVPFLRWSKKTRRPVGFLKDGEHCPPIYDILSDPLPYPVGQYTSDDLPF